MKYLSFLVFIFLSFALDAQDNPNFLSKTQQERANHLYEIIRCPVCSGQSLAESDSTIAKDLRFVIDKKIYNNISDEIIKHDFVKIYGNNILFEPPFNQNTIFLHYGVYGGLIVFLIIFLYLHDSKKRQQAFQNKVQDRSTNLFDND